MLLTQVSSLETTEWVYTPLKVQVTLNVTPETDIKFHCHGRIAITFGGDAVVNPDCVLMIQKLTLYAMCYVI